MTFDRPYLRRMAHLAKKNDAGLVGSWDMVKTDSYTVLDGSINGNDGTIIGLNAFEFDEFDNKIHFAGNDDDRIVVPYDASQDIPSGGITISVWVRFDSILGFSGLVSKGDDATNPNYYLRVDDGKPEFYFRNVGDTANRQWETTGDPIEVGKIYHLVFRHTFGTEADTSLRINNVDEPGAWTSSGTDLPLQNADGLTIANRDTDHPLTGDLYKMEIYSELKTDGWVTREYLEGKRALWKSDYGIDNTASIAGGNIGRTPFRAISGTWRVNDANINGPTKVLECLTTGLAYMPSTFFAEDPIDNAFGEHEFWVLKHLDNSVLDIIFCARTPTTVTDLSQFGYYFRISSGEAFRIQRTDGTGVLVVLNGTPNGVANLDQWYHVLIKRHVDGTFYLYVDDVLLTVTTGTNPVTDITYQTSYNYVISMRQGDMISWSDPNGGHAIIKRPLS